MNENTVYTEANDASSTDRRAKNFEKNTFLILKFDPELNQHFFCSYVRSQVKFK